MVVVMSEPDLQNSNLQVSLKGPWYVRTNTIESSLVLSLYGGHELPNSQFNSVNSELLYSHPLSQRNDY